MDCALICNRDVPEVCQREVAELICKDVEILDGGLCLLRDATLDDIATLSFYCQSAYKVIAGLFTFNHDLSDTENINLESLQNVLSTHTPSTQGDEESRLISDAKTFSCRVSKLIASDIPSTDFEAVIGGWFDDRCKAHSMPLSVDLDNPELLLHAIITARHLIVGVDVIGFDLSKRPYKLLPYPSSLNGVMAYTIARLTGVTKDSVVLDPFCGSGTIPIEIALFQNGISPFSLDNSFSGFSLPLFRDSFERARENTRENTITVKDKITGYDNQFKVMIQSKKHAKIAHVKDAITISKVDIDWVDTKFDADSVDIIVTNPPKENRKTNNRKDIQKLYDDFCYQIRHILKPSGTAGVLLVRPELLSEAAKPHNLSVDNMITVHSGEQEYQLVLLSKKSDKPAEWD